MVDKYKINDYLATINNRDDIDLLELLDFYWKEYLNAQEAGEDRDTWEAIKYHGAAAALHLGRGDHRNACIFFFFLGEAVENLRWPKRADYREMARYAIEGRIRLRALELVNLRKARAKEIAAGVATIMWEADIDQKIRLGEMCHQVWALTMSLRTAFNGPEDILVAFPDKPQGLKPWLRSVAPEYAKKAGRPRKR